MLTTDQAGGRDSVWRSRSTRVRQTWKMTPRQRRAAARALSTEGGCPGSWHTAAHTASRVISMSTTFTIHRSIIWDACCCRSASATVASPVTCWDAHKSFRQGAPGGKGTPMKLPGAGE